MSCWIKLGIDPTTDEALIRNAYRARLPEHHPETDPEGFQALRQAYESALRLVRDNEQELEASQESEPAPEQAILDFDALLNDPVRRFNPDAWQAFIKALDQLPLGLLDDLRWELFQRTANAGPLSYRCAGLLAQRMGWEQQLLELGFDQARHVEDYLNRIKAPDPFDTALMGGWSEPAQTESLWFARSLDFIFDRRPLHEYEGFASQHTCLPLPNDAVFIKRLLVQFTQAGIGARGCCSCASSSSAKRRMMWTGFTCWRARTACWGWTIRHCLAGSGFGRNIVIPRPRANCWRCAPNVSRTFCRC